MHHYCSLLLLMNARFFFRGVKTYCQKNKMSGILTMKKEKDQQSYPDEGEFT